MNYMEKIKILVDSPSDIPDADLLCYNIDMVGVPIYADGEALIERERYSCVEFYPVLEGASATPSTSCVPMDVFTKKYIEYLQQGYSDVIVITMNAGGSGTHESAQMAAVYFFEHVPEAIGKMTIHIVDSMTYSMAYGYPTIKAAEMVKRNESAEMILDYLKDIFSRIEISLVCYTLEYARKSGRITAAAAVMGEALGLKPIIEMVDGRTQISSKVRGDKKATHKLIETYRQRRVRPTDLVFVVSASVDAYGNALVMELEQELGRTLSQYKAGAAIAINAGPRMAALCYLSRKRSRDEVNRPSVVSYRGLKT